MVETVADMVNSIGIDTLSAVIEEINMHIKEAPERKITMSIYLMRYWA